VKTPSTNPRWPGLRRARAAFSLIEVLVVVALLSFIIIGLVMMFSQTQRAWKLGTTQVDVLEAGRGVTDLMTREMAQMAAAHQPNLGLNGAVNCRITLHNYGPFLQELPASPGPGRTNLLDDVFFLTKENQRWSGIGYSVFDPATGLWPAGGVGTLYRFETNSRFGQPLWELHSAYKNSWYTNANVTRLLDGVVHFRVRAYDTNGVWVNQPANTNIYVSYNLGFMQDEPDSVLFYSNAIPGSVEIELGILEERALERVRSIDNPAVRADFLKSNSVGKVHLFRWRVPVRNVDPVAYQ
jgi:type II secretory pathway pseudopilin PulG